MDINNITQNLQRVFCNVFETELTLNNEMTADNVEQWDSLSHMMMIAEVEEQFGIKFKLKELNKLNNVGGLIRLIEEKLG